MKILNALQLKKVDAFTIAHEPILSIDLMQRAARKCADEIMNYIDDNQLVYIFCGKGNNGGDGLAIANILYHKGFQVKVFVLHYTNECSIDAQTNYLTLKKLIPSSIIDIYKKEALSTIELKNNWVIDALLGSGLNKPVEGLMGECIQWINTNFKQIISIDVPSGLYIHQSSISNKYIIESKITLSLELPKLAYLLAENEKYVPQFTLIPIGLSGIGISLQSCNYYFTQEIDIIPKLLIRNKFSHKGSFGHALLLAGSKGKYGAAIISAKACLRSGCGKFTIHATPDVIQTLLNQLPEAMSVADSHQAMITTCPENLNQYTSIAFGPGVGTHKETEWVLKQIIDTYEGKLLIDADGLNMLSENKLWLTQLPINTILTPHFKEFERLTCKPKNDFDRLDILKRFSITYKCIVILKGAYSVVSLPNGELHFNATGNAGLAKAGSGDGLTGIILGLLSRGYSAENAAIIGVYIHGLAADLCAQKMSKESILISDVIAHLPKAFKYLEEQKMKNTIE